MLHVPAVAMPTEMRQQKAGACDALDGSVAVCKPYSQLVLVSERFAAAITKGPAVPLIE